MAILQRKNYPKFLLAYPELKGVSYGACIGHVYEPPTVYAHSHTREDDPHKGWICIRNEGLLGDHQLIRHELAHVLTGHGHDDVWRNKLIKIGGHLDAYTFWYNKKREFIEVPCYHKVCMIASRKKKA